MVLQYTKLLWSHNVTVTLLPGLALMLGIGKLLYCMGRWCEGFDWGGTGGTIHSTVGLCNRHCYRYSGGNIIVTDTVVVISLLQIQWW